MPNQFLPTDPNETLRIAFLCLVALSISIAKVLSVRISGLRSMEGLTGFWLTPLLSVTSWQKSIPLRHNDKQKLLIRALGNVLAILAGNWLVLKVAHSLDLSGWVMSYAVALPALAYQMGFNTLVQICCLTSGRAIPYQRRRILDAKTLPQFWQNWSPHVHDGFKQLIFKPLSRRPALASFAVFAFSGLWHELLINVPLLLIFGVNLVGGWTVYFLIQWLAIIVDHRFLRSTVLWRRILLYLAVVVPLPLALNEGVMRILGWWSL